MEATLGTALKLGLTSDEYNKITTVLGRTPNFTELSVYSVMWSEHCSYKNSILWLKKLPKKGERVLAAAGEENAGLIKIDENIAVCFKIESHNHPSAIEPFNGAATGVGGIHRDIFTMGARPIATLNSLRFGDPKLPKTRKLLAGVVKGISHYGNCFGVPTTGGEVYFNPCYNTNPLVNAMSVGIVEHKGVASATAKGLGNPVFIVGSATGKDGIHGATFASEDISAASSEKLPSIQIGDPFIEKLLLEATLEAINSGAVVGIQDMGAAGIACSSSEMSAKGEVGMDLWLDKVPMRQSNMVPFELLLSESQERMLVVVEKGKEDIIQNIFSKWDISCVQIGVVTDSKMVRYYWHNELAGEIPAESLVLGGGAPVYVRESKEPSYKDKIKYFKNSDVPVASNFKEVTEFLLQLPSIASKRWIYRQYDSMVGTGTMSTNNPSDAAVVHIHGTNKAIAMTVDCNARYVYADPEKGCALAVAEAARNLVCSGAIPLGVTNCLNFGNPYNPEVYWQFSNAITGMAMACDIFNLPVTGGNVSFYNQSEDGPIDPTPTIGMVGLIEDASKVMGCGFKQDMDYIILLGNVTDDIGSSAFTYDYNNIKHSTAPYLKLKDELDLQKIVLELIEKGIIQSAHDVSEGGLIVNLMESAFVNRKGFEIETRGKFRKDAFLFGEGGGRIVISVQPKNLKDVEMLCIEYHMPMMRIGIVTEGGIWVDNQSWGDISHFQELYNYALENIMES